MDATDIKILRLMGVQPFIDWPRDIDHLKPAFLARALKLSPETTKARVRRMEKEGIIAGYEVYPNWTQLGLYKSSHLFVCQDYGLKARAVADVGLVEGVAAVENFLGPQIGMEILHRTPAERDRRVAIVSKLLGGAPSVAYVPNASIPVKEPLSRLDWRIIKALRHRATRPLPEIASELRVSQRTVRRRLDHMWDSGGMDTVVHFDVSNIRNHILANFHIRFTAEQDPKTAQRFYREFESEWAYCWSPPDRRVANLVAGLVFRSPADVERAVRRLQEIPGVASAEPFVTTSYQWHEKWLDETIEEKIRQSSDTPAADAGAGVVHPR